MSSPPDATGKVSSADLESPELGRGTAWALTGFFLLFIAGIPLGQAVHEVQAGTPIRALELLRDPPRLADFDFVGKGNPLHVFEQSLVEASVPRRYVQQHLQEALTQDLHYGTSSVVLGPDGWLFYRPTIDYLSAVGSQSSHIASTRAGTEDAEGLWAAVMRFHADCQAAGVELIVMPVPEKEHFYPHHLTPFAVEDVPPDANLTAFLARLKGLGIHSFDPTPVLEQAAREMEVFPPQETHWTPAAMDRVATALAREIRSTSELGTVAAWKASPHPVTRLGDLVYSLQLPPNQRVFVASPAATEQISRADEEGKLWESDPRAEVVLLGDSYTNIYSQADLGWGESSGLGAHLAWRLAAPVETIAVNAGGASGSRRQLASHPDPLGGKRVVVWEFGARNLTQDAWEVIPIKGKKAQAAASDGLVLEGDLLTRPALPPPETLYPNARVFLKFRVRRVVSGAYPNPEVLVQLPVMSNRTPTAALRYRVGGLYQLRLSAHVPAEWEGQPVVDDTREYDLSPLWATQVDPVP